jgi:hypothetical protein
MRMTVVLPAVVRDGLVGKHQVGGVVRVAGHDVMLPSLLEAGCGASSSAAVAARRSFLTGGGRSMSELAHRRR